MMSPMLSGPKLPSEFQKRNQKQSYAHVPNFSKSQSASFHFFIRLIEWISWTLFVELKRQALRMNKYRSHVKKQSLFIPLKSVLETVLLKSPISSIEGQLTEDQRPTRPRVIGTVSIAEMHKIMKEGKIVSLVVLWVFVTALELITVHSSIDVSSTVGRWSPPISTHRELRYGRYFTRRCTGS